MARRSSGANGSWARWGNAMGEAAAAVLRWACLFFFVLICPSSWGHQGSTCYLSLVADSNQLRGRWEIPVHDLDLALALDTDQNQEVSGHELSEHFAEVQDFALKHLRVELDGRLGVLAVTNPEPVVRVFSDGASLALDFTLDYSATPQTLAVEYTFLFDRKPLDRAFLQLECRGVTQTAIFTVEETRHQFDLGTRRAGHEFLAFLWHGVWHIWIGYDHILFLLALLLPAVLYFEERRWKPVPRFREAFLNVVQVVTAFTVAHSITLSLAALEIVRLPSRAVEAAIAASVLLAAFNNIRVMLYGRIWMVAFGFGLIHGFGFANVLTELGLPRQALVMALVGFNLGVELGQLAIVIVFLPVAFWIRDFRFYQTGVMKFGSACIALVASLWLVERVFDVTILALN